MNISKIILFSLFDCKLLKITFINSYATIKVGGSRHTLQVVTEGGGGVEKSRKIGHVVGVRIFIYVLIQYTI